MTRRAHRAGWAWAAAALLALAPHAHAGTEEFSSFHPVAAEEDDESSIDHMLAAAPVFWRDTWDHSPNGLRTSQGCLTSGQWIIDTRLRFETAMGEHARLGLDFTDHASDYGTYQYFDLGFHWPVAAGRIDAMFRPFHDKSRQDFGLGWSTGGDTSTVQVKAMFIIEDMFNNLWAWRQTRVGDLSEPFVRHPYEPNLSFAFRQPRWRFEGEGRYLTPSIRHTILDHTTQAYRASTLWGVYGRAAFEGDALGFTWLASSGNRQARSESDANSGTEDVGGDMRVAWTASAGARRHILANTTLEGRYVYVDRNEAFTQPAGAGVYHATERIVQAETWTTFRPTVRMRLGWMHDRISVSQDPRIPTFTWGSRGENRAYVGLTLRFGRVDVSGMEGIELDKEPYDVAFHHDKGFLSLQTTF